MGAELEYNNMTKPTKNIQCLPITASKLRQRGKGLFPFLGAKLKENATNPQMGSEG